MPEEKWETVIYFVDGFVASYSEKFNIAISDKENWVQVHDPDERVVVLSVPREQVTMIRTQIVQAVEVECAGDS